MLKRESVKDHGFIIKSNRITLKRKTVEALNLSEGDMWQSETIGDNQLLLTFSKNQDK